MLILATSWANLPLKRALSGQHHLPSDKLLVFLGGGSGQVANAGARSFMSLLTYRWFMFDAESHKLYYDQDGSGDGSDAVLLATFTNGVEITVSDISIIGNNYLPS